MSSTTHHLSKWFSAIAILAMVFTNLQPHSVSAQGGDGIKRQVNAESGRVSFIGPASGRSLSAAKALGTSLLPQNPALALARRFAPEFGVKNPERDLSEMKSKRSDDGRLTVRYQQKYQGIPVMGGELIVNTNDKGDLYSMNGEVSLDLSLSPRPEIDSAQARETALKSMAKWYEKNLENFETTEPELWIYDESLLQPSTRLVELVWRMEVTAKDTGMPLRELVLVNAHRGTISLHFNQIDTAWMEANQADVATPPTPELLQPTETLLPTNIPEITVTTFPETENRSSDVEASSVATTDDVTAEAVTWYVSTTGSDTNSCLTTDLPCATIHGALVAATSGDTIKVSIGEYTGAGTEVVLINKNITLSGGWNVDFTAQSGQSDIDGEGVRRGLTVNSNITATIEGVAVRNGNSLQGGAIYNNSGSNLILNNSTISNNTATWGGGGGIFNANGQLTLNRSYITGNYGTGIDNSGALAVLTLNNTTVSNSTNTGIHNAGGTLIVNNGTISGNTATGMGGGGILNEGIATLNNSTISGNIAKFSLGSGGGILGLGGTVTLRNTIVAGNLSAGNGPDCSGSIVSSGYNLIGNTSGCTFITTTGDQTDINPNLGQLIGSPGYYPLFSDSPAIDAGNPALPGSGGNSCLTNDERGVTRPIGAHCDIGAYEYTAPGSVSNLSIISGDRQRTAPISAFTNPLKIAALDSQGSPVPGVNITFTAPANGASGTFADTGARTTTVVTNANGIATTPGFMANALSGSYTIVASANGGGLINFNLHNFAWYVAKTGRDDNDCQAPSKPCATINGVLDKADFLAGDSVLVAIGIYTGFEFESGVVSLDKDVRLLGGWDAVFTSQNGWSIIDGQSVRRGISVNDGVSATVERFVIQNGLTDYVGGGIYNSGTLVLNQSLVRNNRCCTNSTGGSSNGGGGIGNFGTLTVNSSTITGNSADIGGGSNFGGGGIFSYQGTLTLNNSTVTGNSAGGGGGLFSYSTVVLNNSTITGNVAGAGGGIYFYQNYHTGSFTFIIQNTLVAGNSAGGIGPECFGPIDSAGYNLIGNNDGCTFAALSGDLVGTSASPIDPQLLLLPHNSPSTFAHPLMPGSPAIDAGNPASPGSGASACLRTDQRGVIRPVGSRCDIGAFEYQANGTIPAQIRTYSGTPQYLETGSPAASVLTAIVLDDDGDTVPGKTVTFMAPGSGPSAIFTSTGTNISTAVTDANGIATSSAFSANNIRGSYIIKATVTGLTNSANFQIFQPGAQKAKTYMTNNSAALPGTLLCDETKPNCTNGSNPRADAAHRYAIGTQNFYVTRFGRDSIDNGGMTIISTVDYCDPDFACPYPNAFWNGEQIVYGNAYGYALADDVVAHEFTHGVTQYESNLFYYYQSGAINESFSDLWGEYYDQTNGLGNDITAVKWLVGEDVSGQGATRNMSSPPAYGDPDMMTSTDYYRGENDNGGVHTNSGVNNKAVYLMVDGGGNFNSTTVSPLGWEKTAAIYYEVNTNLLFSGADYSDLYYALQQACTNLIGQKGITAGDCMEVKDALDAVEMNAQLMPNFNTDAPLCSTFGEVPNIFFADDTENGTSNWMFNNGASPRWQVDSQYYGSFAQSGLHSLYADDYPDDIADATAQLTAVLIPPNAYLHFAQAYDFEKSDANYDGGVLEYSTNGGANWLDAGSLIEYNGYTGTIYTGAGNPLSGRSAFVGASHGYSSTRLNLSALAGQSVSFRWRMGLDEAGYTLGWWVDNIKVYNCGVPTIFADVFVTHWAAPLIERLYNAGVTSGCSANPLKYCPTTTVTRDQMAVFLLKGKHGSDYLPPTATGVFQDVPTNYWAATWIEQLAVEGITSGCTTSPKQYCPTTPVTRDQMAVFLLKARHGSGYAPPAATGVFQDVPINYWAAAWIEQLAAEGITSGCGGGNYCPTTPVTRDQMAVFLVKNFNLP